jgi:hypothetical protein
MLTAGLDHDAVNVIVKAWKRADLPESLRDLWAARWDGQVLQDLAQLSPADRQHALTSQVDAFLQDPLNRLQRVSHATSQTSDPDLQMAGEVATELQDLLVAFGRDVTVAKTSPFTGKLKYATLTDLDVVTTKAIIESSTQRGSEGRAVGHLDGSGSEPSRPAGVPLHAERGPGFEFGPGPDRGGVGRGV